MMRFEVDSEDMARRLPVLRARYDAAAFRPPRDARAGYTRALLASILAMLERPKQDRRDRPT